jgi:chromosome segregation ATPase
MATRPTSHPSSDATLNELSSVIGELRNFAAQQTVTNTHMLEELKKIGDRMISFGEIGAGLVEYRKVLHERFGKIHEQITDLDEEIEKLDKRTTDLELLTNGWKTNWKVVFAVATGFITVFSAVISSYGAALLRALVH